MKRFFKAILAVILPLIIVAGAIFGAVKMIESKAEVEKTESLVLPPLVRVHEAAFGDLRFSVESQGTVAPRTESRLVPEVSGRVVSVPPSFVPGGFFEEGDVLFEIDSYDYRQAVIRDRASVAAARLRLAREKAEADLARREWEELGEGDPDPLTLHEPQLEDAGASLAAAEAALEQSKRNLSLTQVRAPYAGRVRSKDVDVGQFVTRGSPVALLYAVDFAEIRLPLSDNDLAFVDVPHAYRGQDSPGRLPSVSLFADFAGKEHRWQGKIVRTEGEIDAATRLVHVVARVEDPYARGPDEDRPPLAVGLYVRAEIEGRTVQNVAVLPRAALREQGRVLIVDDEERLRFRKVEILRKTRTEIVVASGLRFGERVCISPLEAITDGMKVRTAAAEAVETGPEGEAAGLTGASEGRNS